MSPLTLEAANLNLANFSTHPFKIIQLTHGTLYKLLDGRRPVYQGTLTRCYATALQQIDTTNYHLEAQAVRKLHLFCYLPHVSSRIPHYYKED